MGRPFGLYEVISALDFGADLSDRAVAVLIGYFDDSGTHGSTRVVTMAGYVAPAKSWKSFEREAARLFKARRVDVFHAKPFFHGEKSFRGWTSPRQLAFATELMDIARAHIDCGAACSVTKDHFELTRKEHRALPSTSAYGYCLHIALQKLCEDSRVWEKISAHGLSIVVEMGNKNNANLTGEFNKIRMANGIEDKLASISYVQKTGCKAIQLADYLAYFSWRLADKAANERLWARCPFLDIATERVRTVGCLAENFTLNPDYPG